MSARQNPPFAVIFDMDGVLVHTDPAHKLAHRQIIERYGFSEEEQERASHGGTLPKFYRNLQAIRPFDTSFDDFANDLLAEVFEHMQTYITGPDPELVKFLGSLKSADIPFAIATNAVRRSATRKLEIVGLSSHFETIVTAEDVTRNKPDPDVYLEAARQIGMPPQKCVIFEDTATGVQAGKAAGMTAIGYAKHAPDRQALQAADLIVDSFAEVTPAKLAKLIA